MRAIAWAFVCSYLLLGCSGSARPETRRHSDKMMPIDSKLTIEVEGIESPEPHLHARLTNRTAQPLSAYAHALPWQGAYSMIVVAVRADAPGTVLERTLPIDDPGPATITIQPGETLSGDIALQARFPGFEDARKEVGVIVLWSYRFQPEGGEPDARASGHVVFARLAP